MDSIIPLGGLLIFILASLMWVRTELGKKPSFKHLEEDYQRKDVCNETVRRIEEKLSCIPQMQETLQKIEVKLGKLEVLIKNNGREAKR